MCDFVGAPYSVINNNELDPWYMKYKWTPIQEDNFKKWLVNHLFNNLAARREILRHPIKNKRTIKSAVESFILNYGWTYK